MRSCSIHLRQRVFNIRGIPIDCIALICLLQYLTRFLIWRSNSAEVRIHFIVDRFLSEVKRCTPIGLQASSLECPKSVRLVPYTIWYLGTRPSDTNVKLVCSPLKDLLNASPAHLLVPKRSPEEEQQRNKGTISHALHKSKLKVRRAYNVLIGSA